MMTVKSKATLLIAALILVIVLINFGNAQAFWSGKIHFYSFISSMIFILVWLFYLKLSIKIKAKTLINLYIIYWILQSVYFAIFPLIINSSFNMIWLLGGMYIFLLPMIGFIYPYGLMQDTLGIAFNNTVVIITFLVISLTMLTLGFNQYPD